MIEYDENLIKALKQSEREAIRLKHNFIGTEHLIIGVLSLNTEISNILKEEINKKKFIKDINKYIKKDNKITIPSYTPLLKKIILDSVEDSTITLKNVLLNIIRNNDGIAITILNNQNVNINKIYKKLLNENNLKYGINLNEKVKTKDYNITGRDKELNELIEALCKKDKSNAILIGEAGVGKTAIVEALAIKINNDEVPDYLKNKQIIELTMSSIVSGTRYRGEFEEKIEKIINEFESNNDLILFIDEIHTMIGAGGAEGAIDASNILKPYLARNKIKCIGATTTYEYNKTISKDKALNRRFQIIKVNEPTNEKTLNILKNTKKYYEKFHNVKISNNDLKYIIDIVSKDKTKKNPDKSLELLDLLCTKTKLNNTSIKEETNKLLTMKIELLKNKKFKEAKSIDKKLNKLKINKVKLDKNSIKDTLNIKKYTPSIGFKV